MAMLEGSRLEEQGDMAGAWGWYNAVLRASRHVGMRSGRYGRSNGYAMLAGFNDRAIPWAKDPRTDAAALRRALADLLAARAMTESASESFKVDYLDLIWAIEHPDRWSDGVQDGYFTLPPWALRTLAFVTREPERSRRIARIIFAHWLAQCDRPPAERPPMTSDISLTDWETTNRFPELPYADPPGGPDANHPLSAERLAGWMSSALYVNYRVPFLPYTMGTIDQERTAWAVVIVTLAERLYEREHGELPPSPEALVGPYLPSLPEGYGDPTPAETSPAGAPEREEP
jgi:hypothetical protein